MVAFLNIDVRYRPDAPRNTAILSTFPGIGVYDRRRSMSISLWGRSVMEKITINRRTFLSVAATSGVLARGGANEPPIVKTKYCGWGIFCSPQIAFGILLVVCFGVAGPSRAAASVIYDFSLPANGALGAIDIKLNVGSFLPAAGLQIASLAAPQVTAFSSGTPVSAADSVVGINVLAASSLFGIRLATASGSNVLFTTSYPGDFFIFERTPNQVGTFLSSGGNVVSGLTLNTATPQATLVVTDSDAVPEPTTLSLCGWVFVGIASWYGLRRRSA
jgi:hypothetical protein